ncbi:hypothetical protein Sjap_024844 [Stephania japonica]|uniref:Uncharacterized protein n=1 Tax=Stephania japonica TaxID=461633 RepID=A0AAP0EJ16_9MAGN
MEHGISTRSAVDLLLDFPTAACKKDPGVSKDGALILRKIDMYADLVVRFEELFGYFTVEGVVLRDYSDTD